MRSERDLAGPKMPYDNIRYRGVILSSRWRLIHEFGSMMRFIDILQLTARRIAFISCDSKACSDFALSVRSDLWFSGFEQILSDAMIRANGGYNGMAIYLGPVFQDEPFILLEPYWDEDELPYP
jgi:hypothetical protein